MSNTNKILGAALMLGSVGLATVERISVRLSAAIVEAGYASGGNPREIVSLNDNGSGWLVYFLFFIGFVLLVSGFPGSYRRREK
ncbi:MULTISPECIES: hypothetical protein [Paenibacillus]|uniref:hypothetical protein n=1 Tax=Paenibacillus illinoisensis TaxID=59845 RepID=UPI001C8E62BC|nr:MULTISPECIES: hypothetical protein [Paenibacillus]MBY0218795.1 hypothetical protein [Paenibacillus illinoisensis]WJH29930.1 hypothetical protein N6H13_04080 [Paenibacillus sp. CC-CFT742]